MNAELIIGQTVTNKMNKKGTVESYEEGRIVVSFSDREATFQCPMAFADGFLRAEDDSLQEKLLAEAAEVKKKAEEMKAESIALRIQKQKEETANRGKRGAHRAMVTKGEVFRTHAEALNECFGYSYKHFQTAFKQIDDENGAWFPSIAKRVMGEYVAADTSYGWLNVLCENETVILEKNVEDPSKNTTRDKSGNRFVFAKFDGEDVYTFIGLFSSDPVPTKDGFRYELLGTQIDLDKMEVIR